MPTTFFLEKPVYFCRAITITSSGLVIQITKASGEVFFIPSATSLIILRFILNKSSLVIPGFLGTPAVIIITAGVPRKPGMTRDDLLGINLKIIKQVAEGIKKYSPNAFVICITNPLDVMVMAFQKYSGLPTNKVVGMAGILDSSRFKLFLSLELNVPVKEIHAMVMGGHGDTMVPLPRFTKISGKPLNELVKQGKISEERLESINQRTRDGGAEIVKYLEKGSAFYAPAASGVEMAKAYMNNENKVLPCAAYLNGEYGVNGIYAGVPVVINNKGINKIEVIELDQKEKEQFDHSIEAVKKLWDAASAIDPDLKK